MAHHLLHLLGRPHYHHGHRRHAGPRRRYHHRDRPHRLRHRVRPLPSTVALDATPAAPSLSPSRPTSLAPPPRHILLTIVLTVPPASPSPSSPLPSSSAWPLLLYCHRTCHRSFAAAILIGGHLYWRCHFAYLRLHCCRDASLGLSTFAISTGNHHRASTSQRAQSRRCTQDVRGTQDVCVSVSRRRTQDV